MAALIMFLINIPGPLMAQFEQMLSVNISGGYFNTFGKIGYEPDWATHPDELEPTLMPNFDAGPSITAGIQYNFSRHFSLEFQFSYMFSPGWYFDNSDGGSVPVNYLSYDIYDPITGETVASGENYMDLTNLQIGIAPRYYFLPGKRVNPYLFAGITLNNPDVYFENLEKEDYIKHDMMEYYEESTDLVHWFDYDYGLGITAGAGIEFVISDRLGLFAQARYDFVPLHEDKFVYVPKHADFHAINIHLGARISFLKSKEL
jgi:hypothetical protein